MPDDANEPAERNVLDLIADLKSGVVPGNTLDKPVRQSVVGYLASEGASTAEISRLIGKTDRTIRRDLEEVRAANALMVDPEFAGRIAGEILIEARTSIARIRRTTRDKDAPHAARIDGERAVVEIYGTMISKLQSLGYLPLATPRIQADVTHQLGEMLGYDELREEIDRIATVAGPDAEQLTELRRLTDRAASTQGTASPGTGGEGVS
ncbi:MAG: hypothetical protein RLN60_05735 [Phycisphaerales bacterium]